MKKPRWLRDVESELGRPLRVLHLGNVANNAYLNAKIMRRIGIDADAMSYDYYHVMGTPEWEDCDFSGRPGDSFFPDWWRVNLKDFQRPDWFIQGPKDMCQELIRLRREQHKDKDVYHDMLNFDVQYICYRVSPLFRWPRNPLKLPAYLFRRLHFYLFAFLFLLRRPRAAWMFIERRRPWITNTLTFIFKVISAPFVFLGFIASLIGAWIEGLFEKTERQTDEPLKEVDDQDDVIVSKISTRRALRSHYVLARRMVFERRYLRPALHNFQTVGSRFYTMVTGRKFSDDFGMSFGEMILPSLRREYYQRIRLLETETEEEELNLADLSGVHDLEKAAASKETPRIVKDAAYLKKLIELFHTLRRGEMRHLRSIHHNIHASLPSATVDSDMLLAFQLSEGWQDVFDYYDIVQCYAVDCILPMSCGLDDFIAYEHGTLRSIPFQNNPVGRLSRTGYCQSKKVMVTNLDNLEKCDLMELSDTQVVCLPHAMDDTKLLGFRQAHAHIKPDNTKPPLFLSPSRQDWVDGDLNFAKGNDHFLRAVKILMDEGFDMRIVLVEWGRHLDESKALIEELGIGHFIEWVPPMKKADLWKAYFSAHAIVDQFTIPAFGSVTFEALTFGKRVISRIDTVLATRFFGECPPMLTCWDAETVANAMRLVLTDPEDVYELEKQTFEWARRYHGTDTITNLQLEAYKPLIERGMTKRQKARLKASPIHFNQFGLTCGREDLMRHESRLEMERDMQST